MTLNPDHYLCLFCMQFLFFFGLHMTLVNITDFTLWNVKDLILTEAKLILLSPWLCKWTSFSLGVSCMYLGCLGVDHACSDTLELQHTALKWPCFPHTLYVFLNARHCL